MRTDYMRLALWPILGVLASTSSLLMSCSIPGDGRILVEDLSSPTPQLNRDDDNDGVSTFDGDCDDEDGSVFPDAPEGLETENGLVADGKDNNCNGLIDEGTDVFDDDADGVTEVAGDCDDSDSSIAPGRTDGCDAIDNDCDDIVDEDSADAYEPNELPETSSNLGDITCRSVTLNFNMTLTTATTESNESDVDFYRIQARETPNCDFGVQVLIVGPAAQTALEVTLYQEVSGALKTKLWTFESSTPQGDNNLLQFGFSGDSTDNSGTYLVEIHPTGELEASCRDDLTLEITGETP